VFATDQPYPRPVCFTSDRYDSGIIHAARVARIRRLIVRLSIDPSSPVASSWRDEAPRNVPIVRLTR
jgi:hypothetical protein